MSALLVPFLIAWPLVVWPIVFRLVAPSYFGILVLVLAWPTLGVLILFRLVGEPAIAGPTDPAPASKPHDMAPTRDPPRRVRSDADLVQHGRPKAGLRHRAG